MATHILLIDDDALLRRSLTFTLERAGYLVSCTASAEQPIGLPPREFDLLYVLAAEAGRVLPVDDLLERVWGAGYEGESQVVYVHIRWLREKVETDSHRPRRIITVRGVGYKLEPQEAP